MTQLPNLQTSPDLPARLVEAARNHKMTPAERFEQRVSFVYGQMSRSSGLTKDDVRRHLGDWQ